MSDLLNSASLVMIPSGYKEDVVYSQIPTDGSGDLSFTRASNGTRINSAGLVEVCPWNLQTYSEDFTNGKYTLAAASITSNATNAPNGTATADKLVENTANDQHYIFFTSQQTAYNETRISVYAKSGGRTKLLMWESAITNAQSLFDLSTGVVSSSSSGNAANLSTTVGQIEDAGNGWYRCSFNYSTSSGGGTIRLQLYTTTTSYTGDGTSGIFIWGLQENIGSTAKPYFPTTDRLNVPRLTYQNGGGGCPSLLLEKQSTNDLVYSEQFDNAGWSKEAATSTANQTTSPDGTQNADTFIDDSVNSRHIFYQQFNGNLATARTFSLYAKQNSLRYLFMSVTNTGDSHCYSAIFDLQSGTVSATKVNGDATISASIVSAGNGWYRCIISGTMTTGTANYFPLIGTSNRAGFTGSLYANNTPEYSGSGQSIYLWGAQLEASTYQTSYIVSTSSSATRVADACSKTGISSLIGGGTGTWFMDFEMVESGSGLAFAFNLSDGTSTNHLYLYYTDTGSTWKWGGTDTSITLPSTLRKKVAIKYSSGTAKLFCNGSLISTLSISSSFSRLDIGNRFSQNYPMDGKINEAFFLTTSLTDAECQALTTI